MSNLKLQMLTSECCHYRFCKYDKLQHTVLFVCNRFKAPLPTHFFVILTSCKNSSVSRQKCDGPIETVSFILPHRPDTTEMCAVSGVVLKNYQ